MNPVVSIQARLGSSRLPGKVMYPLGQHRVLGWVVNRCLSVSMDIDVVVATGNAPENEAITEWCRRHDVSVITGPEDDLLERHVAVVERGDFDSLVRITGDCPFVPESEITRVIQEHDDGTARYTTNCTDAMPVGTAVDVVDSDILEELRSVGERHPVRRLREEPERWDSAFSPNEEWTRFNDVHMAVDTPMEYWQLVDAIEEVGPEPVDIAGWLSQQ